MIVLTVFRHDPTNPGSLDHALAFHLSNLEDQFPFLESASFARIYTHKIEWRQYVPPSAAARNRRKDDSRSFVAKYNYCQIFRHNDLTQLLADVEYAMEGTHAPQAYTETQYTKTFAGGVRYYVPGGQPVRIVLCILRPLTYALPEHGSPGEWILEAGWRVYPKAV